MKLGGKYGPLNKYLASSDEDEITLSFLEIEKLIGRSLPISANEKGWWSNRKNALQASAWIEAGYEVNKLDVPEKQVTFRKVKLIHHINRNEAGAVLWDKELIKSLRKHMGLTQAQFAEVLGIRQQTVSEWEQGMYKPTRASSKHLRLIAEQAGFQLK